MPDNDATISNCDCITPKSLLTNAFKKGLLELILWQTVSGDAKITFDLPKLKAKIIIDSVFDRFWRQTFFAISILMCLSSPVQVQNLLSPKKLSSLFYAHIIWALMMVTQPKIWVLTFLVDLADFGIIIGPVMFFRVVLIFVIILCMVEFFFCNSPFRPPKVVPFYEKKLYSSFTPLTKRVVPQSPALLKIMVKLRFLN